MNKDILEKRQNALYEKLVPAFGHADTVEGEHLRAINRLIYRFNNDGDYFMVGYGIETAGPAHAYLKRSNDINIKHILNYAETCEEDTYNDYLYKALEAIVEWIESRNGEYRKNNQDMLDCKPLFDDDEDY